MICDIEEIVCILRTRYELTVLDVHSIRSRYPDERIEALAEMLNNDNLVLFDNSNIRARYGTKEEALADYLDSIWHGREVQIGK